MRIAVPLAAALALTMPSAVVSQSRGAFVIEQTGQAFDTIDAAVTEAHDSNSTILIAPGVYRQCTVQITGNITYKAREPGTVVFEGETCEDKAAFVLRGKSSVVDGIVFRGFSVADGNGAGIRIERGNLIVRNSMFLDSQEGILGASELPWNITIDRSTFAGLGQCDESESCAHSIYLETTGLITVTRSRFERGEGGHYIKLRGPRVDIRDNSFDDTRGQKTNYMIDLSVGGTGVIAGNSMVQGRNKENWTAFIAVSPEAREHRAAGLRIEGNDARLAPGVEKNPVFVANASGERLAIGQNNLGPGIRPYETR